MHVDSQFDSGNIVCHDIRSPDNIRLTIRKDANSDFYQWFYFRIMGAAHIPCRFIIENAAGSAYSKGWNGYKARVSTDRKNWTLAETSFDGKHLCITHTPASDVSYFAYFAPYTYDAHMALLERCVSNGAHHHLLGKTLDGRSMDMLQIGEVGPEKKKCWILARQHPGESMAEWWADGFLSRLCDSTDPVSKALLKQAVFYVIPNMNPDGSARGHLRTNAAGANLNREWESPSMERSPEVFLVRNRMREIGVDFCLDVHGDEELPYNFIAGSEGIPSFTPRLQNLLNLYCDILKKCSPDFQTEHGYPVDQPGKGNMSMCTNQVAESFDCLSMTLEQPFKDTIDTPDLSAGWSPQRARNFGGANVAAIYEICTQLR
jgi:murein tripeptide amidase MpaA